jgi:hypothetical protein
MSEDHNEDHNTAPLPGIDQPDQPQEQQAPLDTTISPEEFQNILDKHFRQNISGVPFAASFDLPMVKCEHLYQFELNNGHTLIRGCIHCGETNCTLVAGPDPKALQWHYINEPDEL